MQFQLFTIDAFTTKPFTGNPAATTLVEAFPDDLTMQKIAAEMNLSETAFAVRLQPNHFYLRWFTPLREVALCGHATLAMSHYLRQIDALDATLPLIFHTLSGQLTVSFDGDFIAMDFPAAYPVPCSVRSRDLLPQILGDRPYECLGQADEKITVVLDSESQVAKFIPNFAPIAQLDGFGFTITAIADPGKPYDFVSRFFAPKAGINEDPVTGSAHCILTPYWAKQLGKSVLKARQLSSRAGDLEVQHLQDRVLLKGRAVTVMRGNLEI